MEKVDFDLVSQVTEEDLGPAVSESLRVLDAPNKRQSYAREALGPTVSESLKEFYREFGIVPPTAEEIANLPPWTEEEAAHFERVINEACEQIDETPE